MGSLGTCKVNCFEFSFHSQNLKIPPEQLVHHMSEDVASEMLYNEPERSVSRKPPIPVLTLFLLCSLIYWSPYLLVKGFIGMTGLTSLTLQWLLMIFVTIPLIWLLRKETDRPTREELGLTTKNWPWMLALGASFFGFYAVVRTCYYLFLSIFNLDYGEVDVDYDAEMVFFAIILGPFWEELIYRVFALTLLARRYSDITSSFMVAFWFIVKHALNWHDTGSSWEGILVISIISVVFWTMVNYLFLRYRSLIIPLVYHCLNNAVSVGMNVSMDVACSVLFVLMFLGMVFFLTPDTFFARVGGKPYRDSDTFIGFSKTLEKVMKLWLRLGRELKQAPLVPLVFILFFTLGTEPLLIVLQDTGPNGILALVGIILFCFLAILYYSLANYPKPVPDSGGAWRFWSSRVKPIYYRYCEDGGFEAIFQYSMRDEEGAGPEEKDGSLPLNPH